MIRIIKYILYDILRTRFILLYAAFLLLSTVGMFQLDSDPSKVILSLLNILLIVIPLISVVFTTIHFFNSYEFIEMMLAQPVNRRVIFFSEYIGISSSLVIAFLIGVGFPILYYGAGALALDLVISGVFLTFVFVSLAFLAAVYTRDKAKAIGIALLFWFYFVLIYDAFILWIIYNFSDYPLEKLTLTLTALNPVDLARIIMILKLDISALMGYTGAFYKEFLGSNKGYIFSIVMLCLWVVGPFLLALRIFKKKDL